MDQFQNFNPTSVIPAVVGLIYYVLAAGAAFFSLSTMYSLIKYSKSRGLAFGVSLAYLVVWGALFKAGVDILMTLK